MSEINKQRVIELPDCAYYISNFITSHEESELLDKIYSSPKPKWKTLLNRRLQNWGGLPHSKGMIQEEMPEWLMKCISKVSSIGEFGDKIPNHVLVNEYLPGQGIMPHEDGPLFHPTIATITLGSHTVLDYYRKESHSKDTDSDVDSRHVGSLLLERCSLLLVKEDLYTEYLHGIREKETDRLDESVKNLVMCNQEIGTELARQTRISLTVRHVPHTIKAQFIFGLK